MIRLDNLPWPPSSNNQFITRGRFRVKSPERRSFDAEIQAWAWQNKREIDAIRMFCGSHTFLGVSFEIVAPKACYITKAGHPKRLDLENRLKAFDALWDVLQIDDARFWEIRARKHFGASKYVCLSIFSVYNQEQ